MFCDELIGPAMKVKLRFGNPLLKLEPSVSMCKVMLTVHTFGFNLTPYFG